MAGVAHLISNAGAALATDAAPNATEPPSNRVFEAPGSAAGAVDGVSPYAVAVGGGCSVRLWFHDPTLRRWFALGSAAVALTADQMATIEAWSVPAGVDLFCQITANTGATSVAVGFLGSSR